MPVKNGIKITDIFSNLQTFENDIMIFPHNFRVVLSPTFPTMAYYRYDKP